MPFFPEGLYTLRPKDVEGIQLEPLMRFSDFGLLAAAALSDDSFFPLDRAIVLQEVMLRATPGAGQNVTDMLLQVIQRFTDTAITIIRAELAADPTDLPVAVIGPLRWSGSILIPASDQQQIWGLRSVSTFNAGAVANSHALSYIGVAIPPGNLPKV